MVIYNIKDLANLYLIDGEIQNFILCLTILSKCGDKDAIFFLLRYADNLLNQRQETNKNVRKAIMRQYENVRKAIMRKYENLNKDYYIPVMLHLNTFDFKADDYSQLNNYYNTRSLQNFSIVFIKSCKLFLQDNDIDQNDKMRKVFNLLLSAAKFGDNLGFLKLTSLLLKVNYTIEINDILKIFAKEFLNLQLDNQIFDLLLSDICLILIEKYNSDQDLMKIWRFLLDNCSCEIKVNNYKQEINNHIKKVIANAIDHGNYDGSLRNLNLIFPYEKLLQAISLLCKDNTLKDNINFFEIIKENEQALEILNDAVNAINLDAMLYFVYFIFCKQLSIKSNQIIDCNKAMNCIFRLIMANRSEGVLLLSTVYKFGLFNEKINLKRAEQIMALIVNTTV